MSRERIQGENPYLEGFLKREEKKIDFFVLRVKGSERESSRLAGRPCGRTRQWMEEWRLSEEMGCSRVAGLVQSLGFIC